MSKHGSAADDAFLKSARVDTYLPKNDHAELSDLLEEAVELPQNDKALLTVIERDTVFFGTITIRNM